MNTQTDHSDHLKANNWLHSHLESNVWSIKDQLQNILEMIDLKSLVWKSEQVIKKQGLTIYVNTDQKVYSFDENRYSDGNELSMFSDSVISNLWLGKNNEIYFIYLWNSSKPKVIHYTRWTFLKNIH